jgi:small GTP-binding protein
MTPLRSAKIMLLGAIGVGKTSLARRLVFDKFAADYKSTIGVDIHAYDTHLADGAPMKLVLWDTDGEFGARIFDTVYIKGAAGAVIVSDVTRPPTLKRASELAIAFTASFPGRPARIIVNKCDLAAMPPHAFEEAGLAPSDVLQTSALTGAGVAEAFASIAEDIVRRAL